MRSIKKKVQFSHSVVSNSLQPHEPQHTRPPCPSPTPRVYPNSCPLSRWCHPTISSCVVPFSSCPQSFPASGSFQLKYFKVIHWEFKMGREEIILKTIFLLKTIFFYVENNFFLNFKVKWNICEREPKGKSYAGTDEELERKKNEGER